MTDAVDPLAAFSLEGEVAVVTGASSGLGARFARVLDRLGATVVLAARRLERIEELAATLANGHPVRCDVAEPGASTALVDEAVARHGPVTVVVANAGISVLGPALRESAETFAGVVNVDLVAPFELATAAARHLRAAERGGSIVMVASVAAMKSTPLLPQAGYVAAKTGLVGLTRELAVQWARYGVRVNALCPGVFLTEMTAALGESEELRAGLESILPLGRIGRPDELDGALAFLASAASSYVTGQTLVVDGGATL